MGDKPLDKSLYYRPLVTHKLIALIVRKGFVSAKGTKHGKYKREGDEHIVMVPRHSELSSGLSRAMCLELIEKHNFTDEEVLDLF